MDIFSIASTPYPSASGEGARVSVQAPSPAPAPRPAAKESRGGAQPSAEHVADAVKKMNEAFTQRGQDLYASIQKDQATGINLVMVQDRKTKEVVSQYPAKEVVAMAAILGRSMSGKGQLLNVKA